MTPPIRIATRQSPLALWQAEHVASLLNQQGVASTLVPLVSSGDVDMAPIDGTRQVGVFTKRIQQALLDDEADVAVHSLKDLPTEPDPRLQLAAIPERETVADALVSAAATDLMDLPKHARIGTGSRRRAAQLLSLRPDLKVLPIRGNVQTRLSKLEQGEYDAIMLAEAGILRLEMHDLARSLFSLDEMLPAPGQGALGIETRAGDRHVVEAVSRLDYGPTRMAVTAERRLLSQLHGGCLAPIAAYAQLNQDRLVMSCVVLSQAGDRRLDQTGSVDASNQNAAMELADSISQIMIDQGAIEMIRPIVEG
jgi:hydroxymethylbilane synthase